MTLRRNAVLALVLLCLTILLSMAVGEITPAQQPGGNGTQNAQATSKAGILPPVPAPITQNVILADCVTPPSGDAVITPGTLAPSWGVTWKNHISSGNQ